MTTAFAETVVVFINILSASNKWKDTPTVFTNYKGLYTALSPDIKLFFILSLEEKEVRCIWKII